MYCFRWEIKRKNNSCIFHISISSLPRKAKMSLKQLSKVTNLSLETNSLILLTYWFWTPLITKRRIVLTKVWRPKDPPSYMQGNVTIDIEDTECTVHSIRDPLGVIIVSIRSIRSFYPMICTQKICRITGVSRINGVSQ